MAEPNLESIAIFFGTGGVGKTTLAASRAVYLAERSPDRSFLIVTIDPSMRLKDYFGLEKSDVGVQTVRTAGGQKNLDVLLFSPEHALLELASELKLPAFATNRLLKILARPHGGMNEIFAIIQLQLILEKSNYDGVIIDTAPGEHFMDFLKAHERIHSFFQRHFLEIFDFINKRGKKSGNIVQKLVSSGIQKLVEQLEKVTGKEFIEEFLVTIDTVYKAKGIFLKGVDFFQQLKDPHLAQWFFVTSLEQSKLREGERLQQLGQKLFGQQSSLVINKTVPGPNPFDSQTPLAAKLHSSLVEKQRHLLEKHQENFEQLYTFPELYAKTYEDQIEQLAASWKDNQ